MLEIIAKQRNHVSADEKRIFPFSPETIQRKLEKIRELTQIEDIRLHDLRTLNITYALIAGVDPKTLTGITGHSDLQMIQKHYSVVVDSSLRKATQKSSDYITGILKEVT